MESYYRLERSGILVNKIEYQIYDDIRIINPKQHRQDIIKKLKKIIIDLGISLYNLILTIDYFDIIHTKKKRIERLESSYIALICLHISMKILNTKIFTYAALIEYIADGDISLLPQYEVMCLELLDYRCLLPSQYVFVNYYLDKEKQHNPVLSKILYNLLLNDTVNLLPSYLAIIAILLARETKQVNLSKDNNTIFDNTILDTNDKMIFDNTILDTNDKMIFDNTTFDANDKMIFDKTILDTNDKMIFDKTILDTNDKMILDVTDDKCSIENSLIGLIDKCPYNPEEISYGIETFQPLLSDQQVIIKINPNLNIYKPQYINKVKYCHPTLDINSIKVIVNKKERNTKIYLVNDQYAIKRVKCVKLSESGVDLGFLREISIMVLLTDLKNSPFFLNLHQIIFYQEYLFIMLDYVENNLAMYLQYQKPTYENKINIFEQLLKACQYLHSHKILHRDIKPTNILIDNYLNIKLIDYDCSRQFFTNCRTPGIGQFNYRPIELYGKSKAYSEKGDVWSCGLILIDLLTHKRFLSHRSELDNIKKIVDIYGTDRLNQQLGTQFKKVFFTEDEQLVNLSKALNISLNSLTYNLIYFIKRMLEPHIDDRFSIDESLNYLEIIR